MENQEGYFKNTEMMESKRVNRDNLKLINKKEVKLKIFDINTRKKDVLILSNELGINKLKEYEEKFKDFNLDIWVFFDLLPEDLVKKYYEFQGYKVYKTQYNRINFNEGEKIINDYLSKLISENTLEESFIRKGIPDFVVVKINENKIKELFFVEVKGDFDSLKLEQLDWIFSNKIETKIVGVEYNEM